jgi:molybdopterin-containing oxidoreductase family membrane subunit
MFLLFLRFLPMVALAEIKAVIPQADPHNYDEETGEFHKPKVEVPKPQSEKV